jgi:hypothetical protein
MQWILRSTTFLDPETGRVEIVWRLGVAEKVGGVRFITHDENAPASAAMDAAYGFGGGYAEDEAESGGGGGGGAAESGGASPKRVATTRDRGTPGNKGRQGGAKVVKRAGSSTEVGDGVSEAEFHRLCIPGTFVDFKNLSLSAQVAAVRRAVKEIDLTGK